jgi:tetratricopeptide (TPR) repeat protein
VRMGLNSGEVVVGRIGDDLRMDYTALGQTVGLAARMEQLAEPGRIYVTQHTERLVRGYFQLRALGPLAVKGVAEPVRVFDLEDAGRFGTRLEVARASGLSRFVGRGAELDVLQRALARALAGEGQVVGVLGEAGVGKSRLCLEFVERARERGVPVWEAHCPAHGEALPHLPILQLLRAWFGIGERDTSAESRRKVAGALLLLDDAFRESLPLLFDFLGVSEGAPPRIAPEARQRRLLDIVGRALGARSRSEPGVLLVDDVHWIDPESAAFLAGLIDVVPSTRVVLLVNYRPEYAAPWSGRPAYRRISLEPLGGPAVGELLDALLGRHPSIEPVKTAVAARSAGNPFFAEELVHSLAETGSIQGEKGRYEARTIPDRMALPPTVHGVLAARIDRAGEREKGVLHAAAVIGAEFSGRVLERVLGVEEGALDQPLARLCAAELILETALFPEPEYAFKHPLTQEVAYRSQLAAHRTRLHAAAARAIADAAPERAGEHAALLARHWEAAGEPLEAALSHRAAAEWTGVRDIGAAIRHWRRIRELLADLPQTEATLRLRLLACQGILGMGWRLFLSADEADRLLAEGTEIAERLGDRASLLRVRDLHATHQSLFGHFDRDQFFERTAEALTIAEQMGDVGLRVSLLQRLAWVHILRADTGSGLDVTERGIGLAAGDTDLGRETGGYSPLVFLLAFRAFFLLFAGRLAEATAELERAIALARRIGDEDSLQFPLGQTSIHAFFSGDARFALPRVLETVDITTRIGNRWGLVMAYSCLGHTYLVAEDWERALEAFEKESALRGDIEQPYGRTWILHGIAEARLGLGETREALRLAEDAVRIAREHVWPYPESVGLLTLSRALRREEGRRAERRLEETLSRLDELVARTGMVALRPFAEVERAELAGIAGNPAGRRAKLAEAYRLFVAIGATGHAERLVREGVA